MTLLDRVLRNEGFKPKPYKDTLGVLTVGHGLTSITHAESKAIVAKRIKTLRAGLNKSKPWFANYPSVAREIVIEMSFQMGAAKVRTFKRMFAALRKRDFVTAAAEMRNSKWYAQTPNRAERMAKRMEKI